MNHETNIVLNWIDNNRKRLKQMRKRALQVYMNQPFQSTVAAESHNPAADILANALALIFDVDSPIDDHNSVYADLLASALERVDWTMLAEATLDDVERTL